MTILLREGLEALLVVVAMLAFLRKAERHDVIRYVHAGWIVALAAGGGAYVTKMLWTMQRELSAAMAMAGRTRIADVDRTILDR